jgi:uncharacterized protein
MNPIMKQAALCLSLAALLSAPLAHASTALMSSIRAGKQTEAIALIKAGTDVNAPESNGTTALHWAVNKGDLALVNQLIKAGAKVNAMNSYGASPMSEAAILGNKDIIAALLKAGADVESPNADGQTALMIVARSNNIETAKLLLKNGANVNAVEKWKGQNAVIWAAAQSQPEMLDLLINAGGDPNSKSINNERTRQITAERRFQWRPAGGITALMYAAREGCVACVKVLLNAKAKIDQGDAENVTPLLIATVNMHYDTAKYLIEAGANINKWSFRGENPVYSAVDMNTLPHGGYPDRPSTDKTTPTELLQLMLEKGGNPNLQMKLQPMYRHIKDDRGTDGILGIGATPLIRAAKSADTAAIALLVKHGAHVNLPNRAGITPVMAAAGLGSTATDTRGDYATPLASKNAQKALEILVANGADIKAVDANGRTALHGAASWGWNEAVAFLASKGADLKAKDTSGLTPIDLAMGKDAKGKISGTVRKDTAELLQKLALTQAN